jgi:glycosyltransferase involved in cell wall biosynthesis
MFDVSVVICTYNRAQSLRDTLNSLDAQALANGLKHEVIVVDNNSSDGTRKVVEEFSTVSAQPVRYVFEEKQGVAYARNTGVKSSSGQVVACVDDDVIVHPNWLESLWHCFQETNADAVGGRIERKWQCERPAWYSEELGGCLINQDFGLKRMKLSDTRKHLVTANAAFRKSAFERYGYFREELGRRGDELVGGEDREFYQRLIKGGALVMYEPEALVYHKVEPDRLTPDYFRRWFLDVGKTLGHEIEWKWHYAFSIAPFWLWKDFLGSVIQFVRVQCHPALSEEERFPSRLWLRHYSGMLWERAIHWFPFGFMKTKCAFRKEDN